MLKKITSAILVLILTLELAGPPASAAFAAAEETEESPIMAPIAEWEADPQEEESAEEEYPAEVQETLQDLKASGRAGLPVYKDHVFYDALTGTVTDFENPAYGKLPAYVIQNSVNGKMVTAIDDMAFFSLPGRNVTLMIPNTVTSIPGAEWIADPAGVTVVCEAGSAASAFASQNGMAQLTPEQNQFRIDSKNFSDKTITVYYNRPPINGLVSSNVESTDFRLAVDNFFDVGEKTTVTLTEADGTVTEVKLKKGTATIHASDAAKVEVSRTGGATDLWKKYRTQTFTFKDLRDKQNIYLEPDNGEIVIQNLYMDIPGSDKKTKTYDAYHDDCYLYRLSREQVTLRAEVDWNGRNEGEVYLWQNGTQVQFTKSGTQYTLSMVMGSQFDTSEDIFLVAKSGESRIQRKTKIKSIDVDVDTLKLDLGSFKLKVPGAIPMIGDSEFEVELENFPLTFQIEDGKIYGVIGIVGGEAKTEHKFGEKGFEGEKNGWLFFSDVKEGVKKASDDWKKAKDVFKQFKDKTYKCESSSKFSLSGDAALLGYLEGSIRPDGVDWVNGGLIIQLGAKISFGGQYSAGPVPMYWSVTLSGDGEGKLNIISYFCGYDEFKNSPVIPRGSVALKGSLSGDTGPGVAGVLGAGIGIRGTLKADWLFKKESYNQKFGGELEVYARAFFAFLSWEKSWTVTDGTWGEEEVPYKKSKAYAQAYMSGGGEGPDILAELYDVSSYHVQDQSYLDDPSFFAANSAFYAAGTYLQPVQSNVYRMPEVQMACLENGTQIMVWLGGDSKRESPNKNALYYSCKSENSDWTEPRMVSDDGTADFQPVLAAAGDVAWVAWQNAKTVVDKNTANDTEATAALLEIQAAQFQGDSFGSAIALTENGIYDHSPAIALSPDGTQGAIFWLQSDSNELTGSDRVTRVMRMDIQDAACGTAGPVYAPDHPLKGLAAGWRSGSASWAATVDMDDNLLSSDDDELYVDGSRFTNNDVVDSGPTYCNGTLYWYQDGVVYDENNRSMLPDGVTLDVDDFTVYEDEKHRTAVVFSHCRGLTEGEENSASCLESEIYASFRDETKDSVSQLVALTDLRKHTEAGIGYYTAAGLVIPCAVTALEGALPGTAAGSVAALPFGSTDLYQLNYAEESHLMVEDVWYDASRQVAGNNFTVYVTVKNIGALPAEAYDVVLWDTPGKMPINEQMQKTNLKAADYRATEPLVGGDTVEIPLTFLLPEDFDGTYEITVTPSDGSTVYDDDVIKRNAVSTSTITLSQNDLSLTAEALWSGDDTPIIKGTVANSCTETQSNVEVALYKIVSDDQAGMREQFIGTQMISALAPDSREIVTFDVEVPSEQTVYMLRVKELTGESYTANNEDFCVLRLNDSTNNEPIVIKDISQNQSSVRSTVSTVFPEGTTASTIVLVTAGYNDKGRMIACTKNTAVNGGSSTVELKGTGIVTLRCFLLDGVSYSPLCPCLEKNLSVQSF